MGSTHTLFMWLPRLNILCLAPKSEGCKSEEAKAAIPPVILSQYHFDHVALVKVVTELASFQEEGK